MNDFIIKEEVDLMEIISFFKNWIEKDPEVLNAVLINYFIHSDVATRMTSKELDKHFGFYK